MSKVNHSESAPVREYPICSRFRQSTELLLSIALVTGLIFVSLGACSYFGPLGSPGSMAALEGGSLTSLTTFAALIFSIVSSTEKASNRGPSSTLSTSPSNPVSGNAPQVDLPNNTSNLTHPQAAGSSISLSSSPSNPVSGNAPQADLPNNASNLTHSQAAGSSISLSSSPSNPVSGNAPQADLPNNVSNLTHSQAAGISISPSSCSIITLKLPKSDVAHLKQRPLSDPEAYLRAKERLEREKAMNEKCENIYALLRIKTSAPSKTSDQSIIEENSFVDSEEKISGVNTLPTEIMLRIFSELNLFQFCKASQVCRAWRNITLLDLSKFFPDELDYIKNPPSFASIFATYLNVKKKIRDFPYIKIDNHFLPQVDRCFTHSLRVLKYGSTELISFNSPKDTSGAPILISAAFISGDHLLIGDTLGGIEEWSLETLSFCQKFQVNEGLSITSLSMFGDIYYYGCSNGAIGSFNKNDTSTLQRFEGHTRSIYLLHIEGDRLYSVGHDRYVKVWDRRSAECVQTFLPRHLYVFGAQHSWGRITTLYVNKDRIFTGDTGGTIQISDLQTGESRQLGIHRNNSSYSATSIIKISTFKNWIFTASKCGPIKLWDIDTLEAKGSLTSMTLERVFGAEIKDIRISNGRLFLWIIADGKSLWEPALTAEEVEAVIQQEKATEIERIHKRKKLGALIPIPYFSTFEEMRTIGLEATVNPATLAPMARFLTFGNQPTV